MKKIVAVWDVPTRVFHWALVGLVGTMWVTGEQGGDWLRLHIWCGETILALLLFRLIWGVLGSQSARFAQFVRGPLVVRRYLQGKLAEAEMPGHNPLGGLMVVVLLLVLLFQVVSGLFSSDVDSYLYDGPLAHWLESSVSETVTSIHKFSFNLILALVAIHVAAVVAHRLFKKQNLVRAMFTGRKEFDSEVAPLKFAPLSWALVSLLVSIGVVLALVFGAA